MPKCSSCVKKIFHAQDSPIYENYLAENLTPLIIKIIRKIIVILISSANTFGKNFMPRVAALT